MEFNQYLKPTISVKQIEIKNYVPDQTNVDISQQQNNINKLSEIGKEPLLYYNGIIVPKQNIDGFSLKSSGFLPKIEVYFYDSTSTMRNQAFARDNTIISLYIDTRTKDADFSSVLRPIRMDFKITDFSYDEDSGLLYMQGVPDIDELYIEDIASYPDMTSWDCLKKVASNLKLGFYSNINNSDDKMNWLNYSLENYIFIKDTIKKAYKTENSFFTTYIDYYYNLNYVDVEKALSDKTKQVGTITTIPEGFGESKSQTNQDLYITSSKHTEIRSNITYKSYEILNQSTKISLDNGYKTLLHYYDRTGNWKEKAGVFLRFQLETNTAGEGYILKDNGSTGENSFFNKNIKRVYIQPLDISNVHRNYNYALFNNKNNMEEIDKLIIKIDMNIPNFNFFRYQKIPVYIFDPIVGNNGNIVNTTLSGEWLIREINYNYDSKSELQQELILSKRELSKTVQ
jgi:hypothetical protein